MRVALVACNSLLQARIGALRARGWIGLRCRLTTLRRDLELVLPAPLGQTCEVATNRGAHVVEMALFAHGTAFPAECASPSERS